MQTIVTTALLALGLAATATTAPASTPLTFAAASDLRQALPELIAAYEKQAPVKIQVTYGSSGKLYAQIENGAPFDGYFSANASYPRQLEAKGLTVPGSRFPYAIGRLVLWTRAGSGIPVNRGLGVLTEPQVRKVAIANPAHAPYGQAAEAALKHAKLYERVRPKLVLGENISQAAHFATTGAADVGLVALSLISTPAMQTGTYWPVPPAFHPPLIQEAVVIKSSPHAAAVEGFFRYVRTDGRKLLTAYGFQAPKP